MNVLRKYIRRLLIEDAIKLDLSSPHDVELDLKEKHDAFMKEYHRVAPQNPMYPRQRYWYMGESEESDRHCLVLTEVGPWDGLIHVASIHTSPKGECESKGYASKVMNVIVEIADEIGVALSLDPHPYGSKRLGVKDLKAWYRKVGFKPDRSRGGEWVRQPKNVKLSESYNINENKLSGHTVKGVLSLLEKYSDNTWIFFDTETTGMHPSSAQLTEIGAIAVNPNDWLSDASVLDQFNEKIKFTAETDRLMNDPDSSERQEWEKKNSSSRRPLKDPQAVLAMTRYGEKGRSYEEEQDTLTSFFEWVDSFPNPIFIAQNASFDLKFLNVRSSGSLPRYPVLDTMQLMQYYLIPLLKTQVKAGEGNQEAQELLDGLYVKRGNWGYHSSSMGVVSKAYGINIDDWHNALADVKMMMEMYKSVVETIRKGMGVDISKEQGKVLARQKRRKRK
jgi:DNA polymerase III epsilon subunit-like protein